MSRLTEFLIRTMAFVRKELLETLRQPRLIALLVLGPFLILLIFGVGYTNQNRILTTLIVVPADSVVRDQIEEFAQQLPGLNILDLIESDGEAVRRLTEGEVDLIIITPADPLADILAGKRAVIEFQHREIDPIERLYVGTLERAFINSLNNEVLAQAADKGKEALANAEPALAQALQDAAVLQSNLRQGNIVDAAENLQALTTDVRLLATSIGSGMATFEGIQQLEKDESGGLTEMKNSVEQLKVLVESLALTDETDELLNQQAEQVGAVITELIRIQALFDTVDSLKSNIIARPFEGRLANLSGVTLGPTDFFVPGTISLLLQHITLTLAALSIVREKRGGSIELFRAAPISALETLLGKSISFFLISGLLAVVLTALIVLGLKTPMEGDWRSYAVVIAVLLYMSLGLGFLISSVSDTDTQAVQYAMIALLASIFFTGFFIALHRLAIPVYLVSALLPATWGTESLQQVMLRGGAAPSGDLILPLILGTVYYLFALWRMRRLMASV